MLNKIISKGISIFVIILLFFSIIILIEAIYQMNFENPTASALYYFIHLPITYWLSVILLLTSLALTLISNHVKNMFIWLQFFMFTFSLFGIPSTVLQNAYYWDTYGVIEQVNFFIKVANIQSAIDFKSFPGSYIFFASYDLVSNLGLIRIAKLFPFFAIIFLSLPIYLLSRYWKATHKISMLAIFTLVSLFWFQDMHLSKQDFSFIIFPYALLLLIKCLDESSTIKHRLIYFLTVATIIVTHPLMSFFVIVLSFFTTFMYCMKERALDYRFYKRTFLLLYLTIIPSLLWLLWNVYILNWLLPEVLKGILQSLFQWNSLLPIPSVPSPDKQIVNMIRLTEVIIETVGGLIMCLILFFKTHYRIQMIWFLGSLILVFPAFLLGYPMSGMFYRILLYGMVPFALLTSTTITYFSNITVKNCYNNFGIRRIYAAVIFSIIIFGTVSFPLSQYGDFPAMYLPVSSMKLSNFAKAYMPSTELDKNSTFTQLFQHGLNIAIDITQNKEANSDVFVFFRLAYNYLQLYYMSGNLYLKFYSSLLIDEKYNLVYSSSNDCIIVKS